jgi:hypothetical protein
VPDLGPALIDPGARIGLGLGLGGFSILRNIRLVECCMVICDALILVVMILGHVTDSTVVEVAKIVGLGVVTLFSVTGCEMT